MARGIGLLGCGRISENHLNAYRNPAALEHRGEIVALCDADPAAVARQAAKHDVKTTYTRLEELASDPRVEIVAVLTPPEIRSQVCLPLLAAGKHLLVEKPFAHSLAEARAIVEAAARHGRRLAVNQNYRWRADTARMKQLVDAGAIGRVIGMHQLFAGWRDEAVGWRSTTDQLALAVMAVHWLDRFRWLTGDEAVSVYCASRNSGLLRSRGEDWAAVTATFRGGAIGHMTEIWCSATAHASDTFVVDGTEGSLVAEGSTVRRYGRSREDVESVELESNFVSTFATSMRELLTALDEERQPTISGRDNLQTIALLEGAYRSAATGAVVQLEEALVAR